MATAIRILVVEDDILVATCIKEILRESGFNVVATASSATEALSAAAAHRPSLALVDIRLAGRMDGIELACLLRDRFAVRSIFLSGLVDREMVNRAAAAAPLGFLGKPFRPSQVFNAIEQAVAFTAERSPKSVAELT